MIVKFLKSHRIGLRRYREGDKAEIDNDYGRRLIKKSVATIVNKPSEDMAISEDYLENREISYE